jgi:hypothetical protein
VGKWQVRPGTVRNDLATPNVSAQLSQVEPGDSRGEQQRQQQQQQQQQQLDSAKRCDKRCRRGGDFADKLQHLHRTERECTRQQPS